MESTNFPKWACRLWQNGPLNEFHFQIIEQDLEAGRRFFLNRDPSRRNLTFQERLVIFARDDFSCVYCFEFDPGQRGPSDELVIDHVVPFVKGGLTVAENLVAACSRCNSEKRDSDGWTPVRLEELV